MRELFRPLRRKVGVVALVVTCGITGIWIRSSEIFEFVLVAKSGRVWLNAIQSNGVMTYIVDDNGYGQRQRTTIRWDWFELSKGEKAPMRNSDLWILNQFSMDFTDWKTFSLSLPHWSIVLPLTLLSAWLLLGKGRKRAHNADVVKG